MNLPSLAPLATGALDQSGLDPVTVLLLIGAGMATVILQAVGNRRTGKVAEQTKPLGNGFAAEWVTLRDNVTAIAASLDDLAVTMASHLEQHHREQTRDDPPEAPEASDAGGIDWAAAARAAAADPGSTRPPGPAA